MPGNYSAAIAIGRGFSIGGACCGFSAKILALTETMIRLENTRGTRQSIYRPGFSGYDFIVPIWDLGR
jgi:hypothetical protein